MLCYVTRHTKYVLQMSFNFNEKCTKNMFILLLFVIHNLKWGFTKHNNIKEKNDSLRDGACESKNRSRIFWKMGKLDPAREVEEIDSFSSKTSDSLHRCGKLSEKLAT